MIDVADDVSPLALQRLGERPITPTTDELLAAAASGNIEGFLPSRVDLAEESGRLVGEDTEQVEEELVQALKEQDLSQVNTILSHHDGLIVTHVSLYDRIDHSIVSLGRSGRVDFRGPTAPKDADRLLAVLRRVLKLS